MKTPRSIFGKILPFLFLFVFASTDVLAQDNKDYLFGITHNTGDNAGVVYRITKEGDAFAWLSILGSPIATNTSTPQLFDYNSSLFLQTHDDRGQFNLTTAGVAATYGRMPELNTKTTGATMLANDGKFYSLATTGSSSTKGYISQSILLANTATVFYSFDGINGELPQGNLIQGPDSKLFGITQLGGASNKGVIFSIATSGASTFKKLFDFNGINGANPVGSLILASDGFLYGMTPSGGSSGGGVIFKIAIDGTGFTKLHDFNGAADGLAANGSLVEYTDGKLYGMTSEGGANGLGTIFSITKDGTFTKLIDFNGANGKKPMGSLLVAPSGVEMYGTAYSGGEYNYGTLFKLANGNQLTKIHDYNSTEGNPIGTLVMLRDAQTVTVNPIAPQQRPLIPFVPQASSTAGGPVYLSTTSAENVSINDGKVMNVVQENGVVYGYHPGNYKYQPYTLPPISGTAGAKVVVFSTIKSNQTFSFGEISTKTFKDAPFNIDVTASSGLPVTLTSTDPSILKLSGNVATIMKAGEVTINASHPGNSDYNESSVGRVIKISKAQQTITANITTQVSCCDNFTGTGFSDSDVGVVFRTTTPDIIDVGSDQNTAWISPKSAGTAEIIAYNDGGTNYLPAEIKKTVNITKGSQNISIYNLVGEYAFQNTRSTLSIYAQGGPVKINYDPVGVIVIDEAGYLYPLSPGETTISFSQEGNSKYNPAPTVTRTVRVTAPGTAPTKNEIIWNNFIDSRFVADGSATLTASSTAGLPITYTSSNPSIAKINDNIVTLLKAGEVTITAKQSGNGSFPAATSVSKTLTIIKKQQWATSTPYPYERTVNERNVFLPGFMESGLPIKYTSSDPSVVFVNKNELSFISKGTSTLTVESSGNDLYEPYREQYVFTVRGYSQTITFNPIPSKTYGDAPFDLSATSSSGLTYFYVDNPEIASVVGSKLTIKKAGSVKVTAVGLETAVYNKSYEISRQLVINKADQQVVIPSIPDKKFGDAPFFVAPTSSVNQPIILSTTTPAVISLSGNSVRVIGSGTANITASASGNDNYNPSAVVSAAFNVSDFTRSELPFVVTTLGGGPNGTGYIFESTNGSDINPIKTFPKREFSSPQNYLLKASNGKFYTNISGNIIQLEEDGTGFKSIYQYKSSTGTSPSDLIEGGDGFLYVITVNGGKYNYGTILKVSKDGSNSIVLHDFNSAEGNSISRSLMLGRDGKLYGATNNSFYVRSSFYTINQDGTDFRIINYVNRYIAYNPYAKLVQLADNSLLVAFREGTQGGALMKIDPTTTGSYQNLVTFDGATKGSSPNAAPIIASDGKLYGITQRGGANDFGVIYRLNADGSGYTKLFDFSSATGNISNGSFTEASDGMLYGTTLYGGTSNAGVVFRIKKDGTSFSIVHHFNGVDGKMPYSGTLTESTPGIFLGTTSMGGTNDMGTIFKVTSDGQHTLLKDFTKEEASPLVVVHNDTSDRYFGLLGSGRTGFSGAIFGVNSNGSDYKVLLDVPAAESVKQIKYISTGHLWYNNVAGGIERVFRMKTDGTERQEIFNFSNTTANGKTLLGLIESTDVIYGMTQAGGSSNRGVLFKVNKDGSGFVKLGNVPSTGIDRGPNVFIYASDGKFYGATGDVSTFFSFDASGTFTKLRTLTNYVNPTDILELASGEIVICTIQGPGSGEIISLAKNGSSLCTIYKFESAIGSRPISMRQSFDGWLYVTTDVSGAYSYGSLFKVRPDGTGVKRLIDFNPSNGTSVQGMFFKKSSQTFSFDPIPSKKLSDAPFSPSITTSSGSLVRLKSSDTNIARIDNGLIVPVGLGSVTITASLPENENFFAAPTAISQQLIISKGDQTISLDPFKIVRVGDAPTALTGQSTSGLPVMYTSSDASIASISDNKLFANAKGTVTITASQPGNDQYNAAPAVQRTFKVLGNGNQSILFIQPVDVAFSEGKTFMNASATSNLPITFEAKTSNISVSGNEVTFTSPGVATIEASQNGNEEWYAAINVSRTFCINPSTPSISVEIDLPTYTLTSSNATGNQWYKDGIVLGGQTGQQLTVSEEGHYSVVTNIDGCKSETSRNTIVTTGIEDEPGFLVDLYPNPATNEINLSVEGYAASARISLLNNIGQVVLSGDVSSSGSFDIKNLPSGLYVAKIEVAGKIIIRRMIKN